MDYSQKPLIEEWITTECNSIRDMLIDKNMKYGNSALAPLRIFSQASSYEQINVRIDDKLSRIKQGNSQDTEDSEMDLIGYLILRRISRLHFNKSTPNS